jgi:hypothetical protein
MKIKIQGEELIHIHESFGRLQSLFKNNGNFKEFSVNENNAMLSDDKERLLLVKDFNKSILLAMGSLKSLSTDIKGDLIYNECLINLQNVFTATKTIVEEYSALIAHMQLNRSCQRLELKELCIRKRSLLKILSDSINESGCIGEQNNQMIQSLHKLNSEASDFIRITNELHMKNIDYYGNIE